MQIRQFTLQSLSGETAFLDANEEVFSRRGGVKMVLMELEQVRGTLSQLQPILSSLSETPAASRTQLKGEQRYRVAPARFRAVLHQKRASCSPEGGIEGLAEAAKDSTDDGASGNNAAGGGEQDITIHSQTMQPILSQSTVAFSRGDEVSLGDINRSSSAAAAVASQALETVQRQRQGRLFDSKGEAGRAATLHWHWQAAPFSRRSSAPAAKRLHSKWTGSDLGNVVLVARDRPPVGTRVASAAPPHAAPPGSSPRHAFEGQLDLLLAEVAAAAPASPPSPLAAPQPMADADPPQGQADSG